jgi:TM2 domain-containing membrane protein YozV
MARQYGLYDRDDEVAIDHTKLSMLSLLFGWMGSHRFYLGSDMAGAIYFLVFVVGLVFTLYEPMSMVEPERDKIALVYSAW